MPNKTIVATGVLAVAGGSIITGVSASAQVPTRDGGGGSHSRNAFFNHHRNWNGNENSAFNHVRLRLHNRNNNIAVARTPGARGRHAEIVEVVRGPRVARAAASPCIAAETSPGGSPTKWVALTQNGQLFLASVRSVPAPPAPPTPMVLSPFTNISSFFPDKTPACVALSNSGNRLNITVIGTNGVVEERDCTVTPAGTIPVPATDCTPVLTIRFRTTLAQAFSASRRAGTEGAGAAIRPQRDFEGPGR
jgi:hypothetical protein